MAEWVRHVRADGHRGLDAPVEAPRHALRRADRPAQHGAPAARGRTTAEHRSASAATRAWPPSADASSALEACADAQRRLATATWPPDGRPRVRMGVHAGVASPRDGDYVALAVHQAARVAAAAHGGQVLTSEVVATEAGKATDIELAPIGRYRLRDFDEPVQLHCLRGAGLETQFPAVRAVPVDGHNLTAPSTRLFGRDDEVGHVVQTSAARPTRHAHRAGRRRQDPGGPGDRFGGGDGLGRRDLVRRPRAVARRPADRRDDRRCPRRLARRGRRLGSDASIISGPSAPSSSSTTASTSPRTLPGWPATC